MCLAVSATYVFAVEPAITAVKKAIPQSSMSTAKIEKPELNKPVIPDGNIRQVPHQAQMSKAEVKKFMETKRAQEKAMLYNALQLTAEQKSKAEALDAKTKSELRPMMKKFRNESKRLNELKMKKASIFMIWKQRYVVDSSKAQIKKHIRSSRKSFEAILTAEQKVKYNKMEEERRIKMQEFRKGHKSCGPKDLQKNPKCHGPEFMGPPPEGMGPMGPLGPNPMGPPPPPPEHK